jgi:hypothetical protein
MSMKKFVASAVTTAVVASAIVPVASAGVMKDVKDNSFGAKEINYLTSNNIIQGYADDTFRPTEKLNRGQAARLFARALNLSPKANNQHGFKDVPKKGELAAAVSAVAAAGIFKGTNGEFDPNRPLTRQEMASVIVRAFKLKGNTSAVNLKDLNAMSKAHVNDVKVLYQSGITVGFKDQTFRPTGTITRNEFAVFLYRALEPTFVQKLESVTDTAVTANGKTYSISASLKGLFNSKNAAILKNANVKFELLNNQISKVTYLEIVESGKTDATEFAGNLVLDAGNTTISGNVKVSANYISLKNLTITGNLEVGKELQNDFYSNNLVVKGKTIVNGGDTNTVVFEGANLQGVDINKENVRVEAKGNTTLTEMTVNSNAVITADAGVTIPKVTVQSGVKSLELNANVKDLSLKSSADFTLSGTGSIENVKVETNNKVNLNVKGTIKNLELTTNAVITLDPALKIEKLVLPAGTNPSTVIANYDAVKGNITEVVVGTNPIPNPNPTPTPGDTIPPTVTSSVESGIYYEEKTVRFTTNESATIYYTLDGSTPTRNGSTTHVYNSGNPIVVAKNTSVTIKYFGVDASGNPSAVKTVVITVVPTKTEMIDKAVKFYNELTDVQKAALKDVETVVATRVSDTEWEYILGTKVIEKVDGKLGTGTAKNIIKDVITVAAAATDETLESDIEGLRTKYAADFDEIFGTDVTVHKLALYANVIQAELRKSTNQSKLITLLTDSNKDDRAQLEGFLRDVRNQVETDHIEFKDFDAQLMNSLGVGFNDLVAIGQRLYETVEPKVSDASSDVLKKLLNSLFVQYVPENLRSIARHIDFVGIIISFKDEEELTAAVTTITVG